MSEDNDQKTEEPSSKRLTEAQEKGNIPYSREISHFLILSLLAVTIGALAPSMLHDTQRLLIPFLADADSMPTDGRGIAKILRELLLGSFAIIALPAVLAMSLAVASRYLQSGFVISAEPIKPKLSKISPLEGFKRMFSMKSMVELIKTIIKFAVVGFVGYYAVASDLDHIRQLPDSTA